MEWKVANEYSDEFEVNTPHWSFWVTEESDRWIWCAYFGDTRTNNYFKVGEGYASDRQSAQNAAESYFDAWLPAWIEQVCKAWKERDIS